LIIILDPSRSAASRVGVFLVVCKSNASANTNTNENKKIVSKYYIPLLDRYLKVL
jgi:hypothetical protein